VRIKVSILIFPLKKTPLYIFIIFVEKLPAIVKAFSARANSRFIFTVSTKSNPNVVECLHGLRGMSLIWVCYGHDYLIGITSPNINLYDVYTVSRNITFKGNYLN